MWDRTPGSTAAPARDVAQLSEIALTLESDNLVPILAVTYQQCDLV